MKNIRPRSRRSAKDNKDRVLSICYIKSQFVISYNAALPARETRGRASRLDWIGQAPCRRVTSNGDPSGSSSSAASSADASTRRRYHQAFSTLPAGARLSWEGRLGSALAAPAVAARNPAESSALVINARRSMDSSSGRIAATLKSVRRGASNLTHERGNGSGHVSALTPVDRPSHEVVAPTATRLHKARGHRAGRARLAANHRDIG